MPDTIIKELTGEFDDYVNAWRDIRNDSKEDRRYVAGDPWPENEKLLRQTKDQERPCIATDELGQYLNQLINSIRQDKRAIKFVPTGDGANDTTAESRSDLVRQIEYESNAQAAYCAGFQAAAEGGYGFWGIGTRYTHPDSFEQEIYFRRIANSDSVIIQPNFREADASDIERAFELEQITRKEFKKRFPKARITDFSAEVITTNPAWINAEMVQLAAYWRKEFKKRKLLQIDGGDHGPVKLYADEIEGAKVDEGERLVIGPSGEKWKILRVRDTDYPQVTRYLTNGVEILEEKQWNGIYIPLVPVFGKEMYVPDGAGTKKAYYSMVRLARNPYMLLCYARTSQLEMAAMAPKSKFHAPEGTFENHEDEWANANRSPMPYLQWKPVTHAETNTLLPGPEMIQYDVGAIQGLEILAEAARRGIQAAMGISALPTAAQRQNEKSGIALQRIQSATAQGSYHFIDNFDRAIVHTGRIINDLIPKVYDTARDVGLRSEGGDHRIGRINDPDYVDPKTNQRVYIPLTVGSHDVTVTVGPSNDSQREAVDDFTDSLAQNPVIAPLIMDLVVKLRNLGPIGNEIAERLKILHPPELKAQEQGQAQIPPQVIKQLQDQANQIQALQAASADLAKRAADAETGILKAKIDAASKERIAALNAQRDLAVEALKANAADQQQIQALAEQRISLLLEQAHEKDIQAQQLEAQIEQPTQPAQPTKT